MWKRCYSRCRGGFWNRLALWRARNIARLFVLEQRVAMGDGPVSLAP